MGLFSRRSAPSTSSAPTDTRSAILGDPRSPTLLGAAGVDLSRMESSLQSVAVMAAVDLFASQMSELPKDVFRGSGADRQQVPMPGYLDDPSGEGYGLSDWCYQFAVSMLLRGNAYGEILARSNSGFPTQIVWLHPDSVSPYISEGRIRWRVGGREFPAERMLHLRSSPVPGVVLGLSPVGVAAQAVGLSLTASRFGQQWFESGAHPGGILSNSEITLNADVVKVAKDRFLAAVRGSREPIVLGKGWNYQSIQLNPEESQFLETQGYTEAQCARLFGPGVAEILGYESGGSMTYSTVESRSTHLLVYALNKWLIRLDRLLTLMLPKPQYVKTNRGALLQSTIREKYAAYEVALRNGWMTVNEVRDLEDMQPVAWGDTPMSITAEQALADEPPDDDEPTGAEVPTDEKGKS